eukprot:10486792-Prorocentrum_lima.AAC.1
MTSSLVGSEMCIRDSLQVVLLAAHVFLACFLDRSVAADFPRAMVVLPVSYTHLTLPTICSV